MTNTDHGSNRTLSASEIVDRLPFRPPYIMLDRVQLGTDADELQGTKNVSAAEIFFSGHFPDHPVLPGVLQLDALFQLAVVGASHRSNTPSGFPILKRVERFKFRKPILPGSQLLMNVSISAGDSQELIVDGTVRCGDDKSCEGKLVVEYLPEYHSLFSDRGFMEPSPLLSDNGGGLDINEICKTIPHRFPFLLIDKIVSCGTDENGAAMMIGLKNVTANEPYSVSTFESYSYLTRALQLEAMAQVGCVHMLMQPQNKNKLIYFMSIDDALFLHPVVPGDQLIIKAVSAQIKQRFGKAVATMYVGDEIVAEAQFKFALQEA